MSIIEAMMKPETYDEEVRGIKLIETHISWVFLTGKHAYKIKKPVNFGFLDYTTLEKRKHFCEQEVILNRRFTKDMYIGAFPIAKLDSTFKVNGTGEIVEYLVKMNQMPQDALLSNLLDKNKVDRKIIDEISKVVADFHSKAETGGEINKGGSIETIRFNWDENFQQTRAFVDVAMSKHTFDSINSKVNSFISGNQRLLEKRISDGRIRDCHGDLHSRSIFVTDRIFIFDCIEFNTRFRYSDVAADVAFLSMDLDYHHRQDLSKYFVDRYLFYSSDEEITRLLPFYECYRAYVRGKVISFRLNEKEISSEEKTSVRRTASTYFDLSLRYAEQL